MAEFKKEFGLSEKIGRNREETEEPNLGKIGRNGGEIRKEPTRDQQLEHLPLLYDDPAAKGTLLSSQH